MARLIPDVVVLLARLRGHQPMLTVDGLRFSLAAAALVAAVALVHLGRRWTLPGPRAGLLAAVTVPGFALSVAAYAMADPLHRFADVPALTVAFAGLAVLLRWAGRAPHRRRWAAVGGIVALAAPLWTPPLFVLFAGLAYGAMLPAARWRWDYRRSSTTARRREAGIGPSWRES
ncbi:hypothetical protein ACQP00_31925 [Dactylosporangium sp. CS-047395]|uniref:hypothetical protein n=1 Tax=Dactylosporangium sp. CS-047395 TaxID=3239936 RepID=UPI003D925522